MALSVLITQCLQRDFVDLVAPHEPLPNKLHVGREEAQRLLGADPAAGPVAQLMTWARAQTPADLAVIHVRDWHDPADARQRDHLTQFGPHCLRGTPGAKLVLGIDDALQENERMVDAIALNDFEDTSLATCWSDVEKLAGGRPVRVGVVGVWTEAKVSFLLYDLKTRCRVDDLATCSALTASASRTQHFNALDQLQKILGVRVFDSVGDFSEWLVPDGARVVLPRAHAVFGPGLDVDGAAVALSDEDRDILGFLYRDSAKLELHPLTGGFSGAAVYRVTSRDAVGHEQAPSVAKLGPRHMIGAERASFEKVEAVLGNHAPSVKGFVDFGERAGIKYAFASMGGQVSTLKRMFDSGAAQERIDDVLHGVFDEILGRLYAAAQYERLPLFEHYTFDAGFAPRVRELVSAVVGDEAAKAATVEIRGQRARNVVDFYASFLKDRPLEPGEYHFTSFVHGDLNGANVLVDGRENVWIIDFGRTDRGHVLKDLAKLENDLLYIYTPVENGEGALDEALAITRALRAVEDLGAELPEAVEGVRSPPFLRAWATLRTLRRIAARLCRSDRDPQQMRIALLRYAVHTLSFDESTPLQKKWALASACGFAEDVMETARRNRRLRIDWVDTPILPWTEHGRFGMTLLPGRKDRGRSLAEDLDELAANDVTRIVSLVTEEELAWAGVPDLRARAEARGMAVLGVPIRDQGVPSFDDAEQVVRWILGAVGEKRNVVLHCMGGLGRTGTLAACVLVARGATAEEAIETVRRTRGPRAIEIAEQARFVREYARAREQARLQAGP